MTQAVSSAGILCVWESERFARVNVRSHWKCAPPCLFMPLFALPAVTLLLRFASPLDLLGLEEAGGCTAVVLLVPLESPPSLSSFLRLFNISQRSRPLQLSRVHPREDECAVTMLVENTLYKPGTGPYCVCVCSLCLSGPLWRAVCQHRSDSPGSSL